MILMMTQVGVVRSAYIGLCARSSSSHSCDYSIAAVSCSHSEEMIFMMMICHESSAAAAGSSLSLLFRVYIRTSVLGLDSKKKCISNINIGGPLASSLIAKSVGGMQRYARSIARTIGRLWFVPSPLLLL